MKSIFKTLAIIIGLCTMLTACDKMNDLQLHKEGTASTLTLSAASVVAKPADSAANVLDILWTSPNYATDTTNYKFIVEIDSAGKNFVQPVRKEVMGNLRTSFTGRELNNILLNFGFNPGTPYALDIRVISSYANNNERYISNVQKVSVTPFSDPSTFTSSATSVTGTLATGSQNALTFSWTPSFTGYGGVVTYTLQYDSAGKNFASPQEIAIGASTFSKGMTQSEINATALNERVAGGTTGKLEYRIKAVTAQGAVAFSNAASVTIQTYIPLLRFYLPGGYQSATGNGSDWDPPTAPEFIRDLRSDVLNKLYYMYVFLPANAEFKVSLGRSWDVSYGGSGGNLSTGGPNLTVSAAGVYRISIDVVNMKYDIRTGRMGFVGGATGAGWTPSAVFPNYALGYAGTNLFVGVTNFSTDGWKLIDHNDWNDGSKTAAEVRTYGSAGGSGNTVEVNGANFPNVTTAGRYRAIWDGRNPDNVKYEMSLATEMRVVGDGINQAGVNDWDPPTSPQMTYVGAGVWRITLALKAGKDIKFLAGNAWGAFDYEDAGAGSGAGSRKIKWEGGDNFKTPATAGTYTITLNENTQTMTIN